MTGPARNEEPGGLGINGVIPGAGGCVVATCETKIPLDVLMCRPHWKAVPLAAQAAVMNAVARWGRGDGTLADVRKAQWRAVEAVTP